jgi:large subunit ribosomal protein L17
MRHRNSRNRLNKTEAHRKALLESLAKHLFIYQSIKTTRAKAKVARRLAEKLITTAKKDTVESRRRVFAALRDRDVVTRLFKEIAPLFKTRVGGYTRIIPLGRRRGDNAEIAILELVEKVKEEKVEKKVKAKKSKVEEPKKEKPEGETHHSAPEIPKDIKEERVVEEVKKEKAKKEGRRVDQKGFFNKFFRRKAGM